HPFVKNSGLQRVSAESFAEVIADIGDVAGAIKGKAAVVGEAGRVLHTAKRHAGEKIQWVIRGTQLAGVNTISSALKILDGVAYKRDRTICIGVPKGEFIHHRGREDVPVAGRGHPLNIATDGGDDRELGGHSPAVWALRVVLPDTIPGERKHVVRSHVVVELQQVQVGGLLGDKLSGVVIDPLRYRRVGYVGLWKDTQERLPIVVDAILRNDVSGKGLSCGRIGNRNQS